MRFSLITPVKNMAPYLESFLNSVSGQSFTDYELIIVDYGSTDDSLNIISKYLNKKIKLIRTTKEYKTPSQARNDAIPEIKGNFVLFPDSDDWLEHNLLQVLDRELSNNNVDTILFQCIEEYKKGYSKKRHRYPYAKGIHKMHADYSMFLPINNIFIPGSNWSKCYSSKIIREKNIRFDNSVIMGDDIIFDYHYFNHSKRFLILPDYLYHYRLHILSITKKYYEDKLKYFLPHITGIISCLEKWNILTEDNLYIVQLRLIRIVFVCFNNCFHRLSKKSYAQKIAAIKNISNHIDVISAIHAAKKRRYSGLAFPERFVVFLVNRKLFYLLGTLVYLRLKLSGKLQSL